MKNEKKGTGYVFFIIFILLFSLLYRPIDGDYWSYKDAYDYGIANNMEDFYNWLVDMIPNNYILWRIVIWLPAAICIAVVFRLMKIPSSYATTFFLLFALTPSYYYTRNALALSVLYLAMVIFCFRDNFIKKTVNTSLFVGLVLVSWFLHKSMPMYIGLALLALFLPYNKKYILIATLVFPFLYGSMYLISTNFLNFADLWMEEGTGENYLQASNTFSANFSGWIAMLIRYIPIIYFYIIAFKHPIPKEDKDFGFYKVFLVFAFFTFYLSFLFFYQSSDALRGRIYKSSMMPFAFAVSLYFKHYLGSKQCTRFIYLILFYYAWVVFVSVGTSL